MNKLKIDIIVPVYYGNLHDLERSVVKQLDFFTNNLSDFDWNIVISINGKNAEKIIDLSKKMSEKFSKVNWVYFSHAGKGHGVIDAWVESDADIISYMDVDLSTDLKCFLPLINPILKGYDLSVGSRYHQDSYLKRGSKRKIISMFYHLFLLRFFLGVKQFKDAQCGFKATNKNFVKNILPLVKDRNWFFESEMLYLAEKKNLKIKEVPVIWRESDSSGVKLIKVIPDFLKKLIELRFRKL